MKVKLKEKTSKKWVITLSDRQAKDLEAILGVIDDTTIPPSMKTGFRLLWDDLPYDAESRDKVSNTNIRLRRD